MRHVLILLALGFAALPLWGADEKPKCDDCKKDIMVTIRKAGDRAAAGVTIADFSFTDATLTVNAGDTVTWTNNGAVAHTVTSDVAGTFDSGNLAPGQTFSFTFPAAGNFDYHCSIHTQMKGNVSVNAVGGGTVGGTNATGTWSGKFKSKKYKQTGGDTKAISISGTLTATLNHVVSDLTGTLAFSGSDGSSSYTSTGKIGNTHFWMNGINSSQDETITISGHFSKKGDSFKGVGIIYEKEEAQEISFSLKKQQ